MTTTLGRPPTEAPPGMLTIQQAADEAGVSYSTAYRHVQNKTVRSRQEPNSSIFVYAQDVPKIGKRPRGERPRDYITLQPDERTSRAWQKAATKAGAASVSAWLIKLANGAAGVR